MNVEDFSLLADSQIMPWEHAADLVGQFGGQMAHLNDPKRFDPRMEQTMPFSLPSKRLPVSKERIQTALAINIAGLIVELSFGPSTRLKAHLTKSPVRLHERIVGDAVAQLRSLLYMSSFCSGDLAWFTREPVCFKQSPMPWGIEQCMQSESVFLHWEESCRSKLNNIVQEWSRGIPTPQMRSVLIRYWEAVDTWIPGLLSTPILVAIRET